MTFSKTAELAFSRTGGNLHPDLPQDNTGILKSLPGCGIRYGPQKRSLKGCLRQPQQNRTIRLRRCFTFACGSENSLYLGGNLHSSVSMVPIALSISHSSRNWMRGRQKRQPRHYFPLIRATILPDSLRSGVRRAIQQTCKTGTCYRLPVRRKRGKAEIVFAFGAGAVSERTGGNGSMHHRPRARFSFSCSVCQGSGSRTSKKRRNRGRKTECPIVRHHGQSRRKQS